jgi:hypothetical protein
VIRAAADDFEQSEKIDRNRLAQQAPLDLCPFLAFVICVQTMGGDKPAVRGAVGLFATQ